MPYDPSQKLIIKAEIRIDGVWTDITVRSRSAGNVWIKHAQSDGANRPETSRMRGRIGNNDGHLTEGNPMSPWYPHIGRGTAIRLSLAGILPADAGRFAGEIDYMEAVYPGGPSSAMDIEAIGTWGVLEQDDEDLRSAMFRSMTGVSAAGYTPHEYWPMEDGSSSTQLASGVSGRPAIIPAGEIQYAVDGPDGSSPLARLGTGFSASIPITSYTDVGHWGFVFALQVPAEPAATTVLLDVPVAGGTAARFKCEIVPGSPAEVWWRAYDSAGSLIPFQGQRITLDGTGSFPSEAQFFEQWWLITLTSAQDGANNNVRIGWCDSTGEINGASGIGTAATHSPLTGTAQINIDANLDGVGLGHFTVYTSSEFDPVFAFAELGPALGGWVDEWVQTRIDRLCREQGITVTRVGSSTKEMGPQRPGNKITDLLAECQEVDQGLWSDSRTDIGLVYRCLATLYTQDPQVAIQKGSLTKDTRPVWDYQQIRNDWTSTRRGGSSATQSDEDNVTLIRRRRKGSSPGLNVANDGLLDDHAGWAVNTHTAPGPRYPLFGINLRNKDGATLADAVLDMDPGDRMTAAAAAFPSQHPPGGADQMVIGWQEELDVDFWEFRPNCVPYAPYLVGVYGTDDQNSRYDSDASTLAASYDADDTSFSVATEADHALWEVGSGAGFAYDIDVAGIRITVTAVSGATSPQTFTVTRSVDGYDKALASGEPVRLWEPARYGR